MNRSVSKFSRRSKRSILTRLRTVGISVSDVTVAYSTGANYLVFGSIMIGVNLILIVRPSVFWETD